MNKDELIEAILAMSWNGEEGCEDTDIGISISEIRAMSTEELTELHDSIKSTWDQLSNI